nr:putative wax ester synthase/acyl-CoA:diacylglycerol acyltransferase [uncultured bacterium]
MQQLSGQDAMFIHTELDGLPQHIGGLSIYDQSTVPGGNLRFKDILKLIEKRAHLSGVFTRKLQRVPYNLDQPYWVESDDFDVERHVHHIALPKPGDWRQLCILASRLHSRPLDMSLPLWEMYVIGGLDNIRDLPKGCFAVMIKVHHAAMDGATAAKFIPALHDLSPEVASHDAPGPRVIKKINNVELLGRAYVNNMRKPRQAVRLAGQLVPAVQRIREGLKRGDFKSLSDKQKTRFQGKISPHRVCDAVPFDFEEVRAIKNSVEGATINDTMLCIVGGGMLRYLTANKEKPEQSLVTGCPIDVRSDSERAAGGNMVGFMNVSLCTDIKHPLKRLAAIHTASTGSKAYAQALGPRIAMDVTDVLPGGMLSVALRAASMTGLTEAGTIFNTVVTNVPGPPIQLYFAGAALVDGMNFGPLLPNVGLFQIVSSSVQNKRGTITLSFTACRDMMPDPELYADCLRESFEELKAAALASAKKTLKKPAKKPAAKKAAPKAAKQKAAKKKVARKAAAKKPAAAA